MKTLSNRTSNILSLVLNLASFILVTYSVIGFFVVGGDGNMEVVGATCFRYFTVLSNVLAALVSLLVVPYNIKSIIKDEKLIPLGIIIAKYVGTIAVTVTFLTVLFFLGPTMGYSLMFEGSSLYLHLIVPLTCLISFIFFEKKFSFRNNITYFGLIPTVLYSIVYVINVLWTKLWPDFYGFTFGGKLWAAPISLIVMYAATFLISFGLLKIYNKVK